LICSASAGDDGGVIVSLGNCGEQLDE